MIIGIVAVARNGAIGKDNKLPWHYSADLKFFKRTTMGNAVVMGSRTWESIKRPLPDRLNIVLSRSGDVTLPPEVRLIRSREELIELADELRSDVFVIGGASVFSSLKDVIEKWLVTYIPENVDDADTFLPDGLFDGFTVTDELDLGDDLLVRVFERQNRAS
ncbi:MAG: dihydrofolate reductase [Acidobacteria bacterium ACB1]|nr:Dihydrofolate reductase type 3 [Pyrinomonadaceae bacterium]MCE7961329.1 dihydrofolate reductase [Acidobacteria bacterium ACB1]